VLAAEQVPADRNGQVAEPGGGTQVALTGGVRVPGRAALVPIGV
jgi:hypothetical protein